MESLKSQIKSNFESLSFNEALKANESLFTEYERVHGRRSLNAVIAYYRKKSEREEAEAVAEPAAEVEQTAEAEITEEESKSQAEAEPEAGTETNAEVDITKNEKPKESKRVEVKTSLEDGVYVVFSSGEIKPVSEYNEQCEPAKVLMIYHDHSWIVAPRDAECGETTLLKEDADRESGSPFYKAEIEALNDFDMESCTAHLRKAGLAFELDDDMFIPTAGQLAAMWLYRDSLNKALKATGGEPLKTDECYWSSSESYRGSSWYLGFDGGYVYTYIKYGSYYVRPCSAFEL